MQNPELVNLKCVTYPQQIPLSLKVCKNVGVTRAPIASICSVATLAIMFLAYLFTYCLLIIVLEITLGWPRITSLWALNPPMHNTLVCSSSDQIWWPQITSRQIDLWLIQDDHCMTSDPSNASCSGHGLCPNVVAIGHFLLNWPLVDSADPCMTYAYV